MRPPLKPFTANVNMEGENSNLMGQIWDHYCRETGNNPDNLDLKHTFLAGAVGVYGLIQAMSATEEPELIANVLDGMYEEACEFNNSGEFRFEMDPFHMDSTQSHRLN